MKYPKPAIPGGIMTEDELIYIREGFKFGGRERLRERLREKYSDAFADWMIEGLEKESGSRMYANVALKWANRGDWGVLETHIKQGGIITDRIRDFLVAVLRGEKKRPNNRSQSSQAHFQSAYRSEYVWRAMRHGQKKESAIDSAADHFGVNRRTIQRDLKKFDIDGDMKRKR